MRWIPALFLLAACSSSSGVKLLGEDVYGLTIGGVPARAATRGVNDAKAFCARDGKTMIPVRSYIGGDDYQIAFRCEIPRPTPG